MKGKILSFGPGWKEHKCPTPFLWFRPSFVEGAVWICDCDQKWIVRQEAMDDGRIWTRLNR